MKRNITDWERAGSIVAATAIGALAVSRPEGRIAVAVAAGGLLLRGMIGYCPLSAVTGRNTRHADTREALGGSRGVHVRETITIARPGRRGVRLLARLLQPSALHDAISNASTNWIAPGRAGSRKAPAGLTVSWDAHIINEITNEVIAWSSVGDADVISAGSVHFKPMAERRHPGRRPPAVRTAGRQARRLGGVALRRGTVATDSRGSAPPQRASRPDGRQASGGAARPAPFPRTRRATAMCIRFRRR